MNAEYYINNLNLLPHPEGGFYRESYRSNTKLPDSVLQSYFTGERNLSTGIYFLLEKLNFSAFHRIRSDEMWHFYDGDALEVIELTEEGKAISTRMGRQADKGECLQYTVKANTWFASRVAKGGEFSLTGCTVSPGFDFKDFELADRNQLLTHFPEEKALILQLTRA